MQRENNEPGCYILFRPQEKLNWSLSGAIAPVAITLPNYMQKRSLVCILPPTTKWEGYFLCSLSHGLCHLAVLSCRNLPPYLRVPTPLFSLEVPHGGMLWWNTHALAPTHSCSSTGDTSVPGKSHATHCRLLNHKFQMLFLFSLAWAYLIFYFSNILCSKHLRAKLSFLPSLLSPSVSPLWRGSACLWTDPISSTVTRAEPRFTQLG